eukprot:CAMPEP_0179100446 /NCGR_PEP_ID=MMETSP0796-20121207/46390_1 /TAXON_ID=73915 /ORGANISM="Pyrodinium bahamense, Strain pbaha01" /LENGTH=271 /DNA_ID=CAMNT_0020798269 /DNA_START=40 /DNA_END=853 /DNA_ORIENTATION=-
MSLQPRHLKGRVPAEEGGHVRASLPAKTLTDLQLWPRSAPKEPLACLPRPSAWAAQHIWQATNSAQIPSSLRAHQAHTASNSPLLALRVPNLCMAALLPFALECGLVRGNGQARQEAEGRAGDPARDPEQEGGGPPQLPHWPPPAAAKEGQGVEEPEGAARREGHQRQQRDRAAEDRHRHEGRLEPLAPPIQVLAQAAPGDRADDDPRAEGEHHGGSPADPEPGVDRQVVGQEGVDDGPRHAAGDALQEDQQHGARGQQLPHIAEGHLGGR